MIKWYARLDRVEDQKSKENVCNDGWLGGELFVSDGEGSDIQDHKENIVAALKARITHCEVSAVGAGYGLGNWGRSRW